MVSFRKQKHFLQGLIEKKYCLWLDVCVSPCKKVSRYLLSPRNKMRHFLNIFWHKESSTFIVAFTRKFSWKMISRKKNVQITSTSSWVWCWRCVRISSYDNWWLWDEDEHNIYGKSFCRNCIFGPKVSRLVQWHHHEVSTPNEE